MSHPLDFILLALAGCVGTLLRATSVGLVVRLTGGETLWAAPVATLGVNLIGSFAFGSIAGLAQSRQLLTTAQQSILLVGLLGGFTTYSSFAFQSVEMLNQGRIVAAAVYVTATTTLALGAAWAGLRLCS